MVDAAKADRANLHLLRCFGVALAAVLIGAGVSLGTVTPAVAAPVSVTVDGMTFTGDDSDATAGVALTAYDVKAGLDPVVPASVVIGGTTYGVTAIGDQAFYNKALTSVVLPNTVTRIGNWAFGYSVLGSVTIPASVTAIGKSAFFHAELTSIDIPDSVLTIGDEAFSQNKITTATLGAGLTSLPYQVLYNNNLTTISVPAGITTIGDAAFAANDLETVTLPAGLQSIGTTAFYGNDLKTLTIPSSTTTIGAGAFAANTGLTSIYFDGDAPALSVADTTWGSFGTATAKTLYFKCGATGFATPTWQGYDVNVEACTTPATSNELPPTGSEDQTVLVATAAALLAVGVVLLVLRRRRIIL